MLTFATVGVISGVLFWLILMAVPPTQPTAGKFQMTAAEVVAGTELQVQRFEAGWHAESPTNHVVIGGSKDGLTRISVLFDFKGGNSLGIERAFAILRNVFPNCDGAVAVFRSALKEVIAGEMDVLLRMRGQRAWLSFEPKSGWLLLTMTPT